MTKVSILIPVYNGEKYIERAITSCINQTHKNIEIIVINDGSTDKTAKWVSAIKDERVRFFDCKENKGKAGALNHGLKHITGEYVSFLDCDDWYKEEKTELQLKFIKENPNCDMVYSDFERVEVGGRKRIKKAIKPKDFLSILKLASKENIRIQKPHQILDKNYYIPACSVLVKAKVFKKISFDSKCYIEDTDVWYQIMGAGFSVCYLPIVAYTYMKGIQGQKTTQIEKMQQATEYIVNKLTSGKYFT